MDRALWVLAVAVAFVAIAAPVASCLASGSPASHTVALEVGAARGTPDTLGGISPTSPSSGTIVAPTPSDHVYARGVAPDSVPTYTGYAGWNGSRALYLTNYTGFTYLPSTSNSSFAYQNYTNSSYHHCCNFAMNLSNAETVVVGTGANNRSYYTYYPGQGWTLWMFVTNMGETIPYSEYIGPPSNVVAWAQFEELVVQVAHAPAGTLTHTQIMSSWDTGINTTAGNFAGSGGTEGADAEIDAMAGAADIFAFATAAIPGVDFVVPPVAAVLDILAATGVFSGTVSSYTYDSQLGLSGGNVTVNQYSQITPNPTPAPGYGITSAGGDTAYAQSTKLFMTIGTGNSALPVLGDGSARLTLEAFPLLGDNYNGVWDDAVPGATPTLSYSIDPAVSIQSTVYLSPGVVAPNAPVVLQATCPTGSEYPSANYDLTANSAGLWHFFAAPGCSYAYSASAYDQAQGQTLTSASTSFSLASTKAGLNLTIAPMVVAQAVTFSESGAPSGTTWSVTMNGATLSASAGSNVVFEEPNGTFTYSVTAPSGYTASGGSVTVSGQPVSKTVTISKLTTYSVSFSESGLPSGDTWSVTLVSTKSASAGSTITFSGISGSNSYSVGDVVVLANGCVLEYYAPSPSSGTVTGSSSISVKYTYTVTTMTHVDRCITQPAVDSVLGGTGGTSVPLTLALRPTTLSGPRRT